MNLIELEEALFPGGKPTEDLRKKVEELKAVNARQAHPRRRCAFSTPTSRDARPVRRWPLKKPLVAQTTLARQIASLADPQASGLPSFLAPRPRHHRQQIGCLVKSSRLVALLFVADGETLQAASQQRGQSMKRTIIAGIAGAVVAAGLGFAAPTQAAPCSYFGSDGSQYDRTPCGVPDLATSVENARTNLRNNLNTLRPKNAMDQLRKNLGIGGAGSP